MVVPNRVNNCYIVNKRIGSGSFGTIYQGFDIVQKIPVAIKMEPVICRQPQLIYEHKIALALSGGLGIPQIYWCGQQLGYVCLVMELLGPSLEQLFTFCDRKLSLKTVCMMADQLLNRVEFMHMRYFIHRDIKPDNFLLGRETPDKKRIYCIDFGLAKKYRSATQSHIPFKAGKNLTGTARYASLHTHQGLEQSRRDDIESLLYMLVYFVKGSLPWQGLKATDKKEKYEKIQSVKSAVGRTLYEDLPDAFVFYFDATRKLRFTDKPNYQELRNYMKSLMLHEGMVFDFKFDWVLQGFPGYREVEEETTAGSVEPASFS